MIILEKPYVSELLVDTILQNDWPVLRNETISLAGVEDGAFNSFPTAIAKDYYSQKEYPLLYSNSEDSIEWILENLPDSHLARYIKLFKNKTEFRNMLKKIYPDFYYREVDFEELRSIKLEDLKFPLVLKPSVGFLSYGVHIIQDDKDWKTSLFAIESEIESGAKRYSKVVVDSSKFIIEDYIDGEEFAIDAYYDCEGTPVILNIFQHPFLNSKDVKDRIYLMSAGIMVKYMAKFALLLKEIGETNNIRNFPLHMEVRVTSEGKIIPIEVNPMRFAGWCTTDVALYAWGINVYEYYMEQKKPDWNEILSSSSKGVYYFSMAEVPGSIPQGRIKFFDYDKYLSNFSEIFELRRINPNKNPLFAVIFGKTKDKEEVKQILQLNTKDYTVLS